MHESYTMGDLGSAAKRRAPAADRNVGPIGDVLEEWLPDQGLVLEIASGTGQHVTAFARRFPRLTWLPSDYDQLSINSIAAWRSDEQAENLLAPLRIDAAARDWPVERADVVLSINMVHIAPWTCAQGLVAGAAEVLDDGGALILYGPWLKDDIVTSPSNIAFDAELRSRNAQWGLRRVEDFAELAGSFGLALTGMRAMPAQNLMLKFVRNGPKISR